jgi:hypothetical protein
VNINKEEIIMASSNTSSPKVRTQTQILARIVGILGRKYQHQIYAAGTTLIIGLQTMPAHAFGLFNPTQIALTCMFGGTSTSSSSPALAALPGVINAAITVILFVYFVASGVKVAGALGEGQEVTQLVQQPIGIFFITLVLFIAQNILFNGVTAAC